MPHLVAIDLPGGSAWVDALARVWDRGDAVLPVDRRLPGPARQALLTAMAPTRLVDSAGDHSLDGGRPCEPGDALVIATSGSTGAPKGVVLTHDAVAASAAATNERLGTTADDTWLACLPLAHVGGLSVITRALHAGSTLVVHDGFDAVAVEAAARNGATAVSLVATALARIDAALFRVIVLGGARPPATRPRHAHTTYGLTETGSGVVYDGTPLRGVQVAIAPDGEVLLRGPMLMRGYRDGTTSIDAQGWLHTADVGEIRPDGSLVVHGRRGDMIVTGGENVWPETVEAVIATLPSVAHVAVAGVPDAEWGHRVEAWIVPCGELPTLDALRAHVRDHLPAFCAPKAIHVVDDLPRTALGKLRRHLLTGSTPGPTAGPPEIIA